MARYAGALLRDGFPGPDALLPRRDMPGRGGGATRIGYLWLQSTIDGREVMWHNGGTAGFRTMLMIERARRVGVFVVGNSTRAVDEVAARLLAPPGCWHRPAVGTARLPGSPVRRLNRQLGAAGRHSSRSTA